MINECSANNERSRSITELFKVTVHFTSQLIMREVEELLEFSKRQLILKYKLAVLENSKSKWQK